MARQNLVSAVLPDEAKADILSKLASVRKSLGFLLTLQPDQVQSLFKTGNGYTAFVDKAYNVVNDHPDILPRVFDAAEFKRDYELSKDLVPILDQVNQLADSLRDTQMAVNSDAIAGALEVYQTVKLNKDRVPGLNVIAEEMGEFFKRSRKPAGAAARAS